MFDREAALARLDDALDGRAFLVGDAVTLADVALSASTRGAHEGGVDLDRRVNLRGWVARVEAALGRG